MRWNIPHIQKHQVLSQLLGSDHLPVQLSLMVKASISSKPPISPQQSPAAPNIRQIIPSQDQATIQRYMTSIADPST